jgi:hypothetical protein
VRVSEPCRDLHTRTYPNHCRSVGKTAEPHPRSLAEQAEKDAMPKQLDLFG